MIYKVIFFINFFIIFEAMIGYIVSLFILDKIYIKKKNKKIINDEEKVTIIIVAHNEEKVIYDKLCNIVSIDYPIENMQIIIASDYSTDKTDEIVQKFIIENTRIDISLVKTKEHRGKTNAQNEAVEFAKYEIIVFTDANSMLDVNSIRELVASFAEEEVAYVTGQLLYINQNDNLVASSEGLYWKLDLFCREVESKLQSITAGNGALYACRKKEYIVINDKECHDSSFPLLFSLNGKRAIYNKDAKAFEKAGEIIEDEYKRKVRMARGILSNILPDIRLLNFMKYGWFSYFYFGHRSCRYLLWVAHSLLLVSNILLVKYGMFWRIFLLMQLIFYLVAVIGKMTKAKNVIMRMCAYYTMTVVAQWNGVINILMGKSKSTWEKAETTR